MLQNSAPKKISGRKDETMENVNQTGLSGEEETNEYRESAVIQPV